MNNLIRYPLFVAIMSVVLSAYGCGGSSGGSPSANMNGSPSTDMDGSPSADMDGSPSADMDGSSSTDMDGSPSTGTMEPDQPDEPFIDPRIAEDAEWHAELSEYADAVRTAAGGSSPTLSSADHDAKLREITANADTITGLAFWSEADGNFAQYDPDCSGTVCTNGSADSGDYTTTEILIGPKEDVVFFPVMQRHGIEFNFGAGEGDHSAGRALGEFDSDFTNLVLDHLAGSGGWLEYEGGQEWFGFTLWGDSTASNPAVGSASWSGALVGFAYDDEDDSDIFGDVEVTVNFGNETVLDVLFSNVTDPDGSRYTIDPWMGVPVSGGSFEVGEPLFYNDEEDSRHVQGRFFGPDAEEVGGLFADDGVSMPGTTTLGVFGAVRGDDQAMTGPVSDPGEWGPYQDALGGQPLDLSATEINAAQVNRLRRADEYIPTDYINPDGTRWAIDCDAGTCTGADGQVITPESVISILSPDYEAIMTRGAASIAYVEGGDEQIGEDWWALSGWLDHTLFFADRTMYESVAGASFGVATGTAPLIGSATWNGVMIGADTGGDGYGVVGNATLTADFASETLDVAFTDIHRSPGLLPTDGDLPVLLPDIRFDDVPVYSDGVFGSDDEEAGDFIDGSWYGPDHAEVGGVFEHGSSSTVGSFGASRQ